MRNYAHKSGHYIAKEHIVNVRTSRHSTTPVVKFDLINLKDNSIVSVDASLIENSNDWMPMIEVSVPETYNTKQVAIAFREFLGGILVHGKPLSYPKAIRFEEIFFQHLAEQKK